jgi:hypothetical protein
MQNSHTGVLQKEFQARKRNIVEYAHDVELPHGILWHTNLSGHSNALATPAYYCGTLKTNLLQDHSFLLLGSYLIL